MPCKVVQEEGNCGLSRVSLWKAGRFEEEAAMVVVLRKRAYDVVVQVLLVLLQSPCHRRATTTISKRLYSIGQTETTEGRLRENAG
jgi:hypothetical protein